MIALVVPASLEEVVQRYDDKEEPFTVFDIGRELNAARAALLDPSSIILKHIGITDKQERENFVFAATDALFVENIFLCVPSIEPRVRAYLAWHWIIRRFAEKDSKRETVGVKVIPRKPA
jgi:hypothetical protein